MNFSSHKLLHYFLYISAFLLILLFAILVLFKFYITDELKKLTGREDLVEGYNLSVKSVDYDITKGFIFEGLQLDRGNQYDRDKIRIDNLSVNINFLYSIMKRKAVLDTVEVGSLEVSVSKDFVEPFFSDSRKVEAGKDENQMSIATILSVDELNISKFLISYDERYTAEFTDFHATIGEINKTGNINFRTNLLILNQKLNTDGSLRYKDGVLESDINLKSGKIIIPGIENSSIPPLMFKSNISVDFNDRFALDSTIYINRMDKPAGKNQAGNIKLISEYSDTKSEIKLSKFECYIIDFVEIDAHGVIKELDSTAEADITGVIDDLNMSKLNAMLADNYQTRLSVNITENKFLVSGSVAENTLNVSGKVGFNDASVSRNDTPISFEKIRGVLDYKYYLLEGAFGYSSLNLIAYSADTTVLNFSEFSLNSELRYQFKNEIDKGVLDLKARSNNFADGYIELDSEIDFRKIKNPINGHINSKDLHISKFNDSNIDTQGKLNSSSIRFTGDFAKMDIEVELSLTDIKLDQYNTSIKYLHTTAPVNLTVDISNENRKLNKISINLNNLEIKGVHYGDISAGGISLDIISPDLVNGIMPVSVRLTGHTLKYPDHEILINKLNMTLDGQLANNQSLDGYIVLSSLHYKKYLIENVTARIGYKTDDLNFNDIKILLDDFEYLTIPSLKISTVNSMPFPSMVTFTSGLYSSKLSKDKISGIKLDMKKLNADKWGGFLNINNIRLGGLSVDSFNLPIEIGNTKIYIGKFQAELYEGQLEGSVSYTYSGNNPALETQVNLSNLKFNKENVIQLGNLSMQYSGEFVSDNSVPSGKGFVIFKNLYFSDYQEDSKLNGYVDLVSHDETMSLENGLIKSEKSTLINFTGGITDPLESKRAITFETKNMNLAEIKNFLNPLLPVFIRYGEIDGGVDINLVAHDVPANTSLNGFIDFHNINLKGDPFSTYFNMEKLDGKLEFDQSKADETTIQEVINLHVNNYEDAYKDSLNRLKTESRLPTLSVNTLEYGFFKFENIKLFLKLIRNKIVFKILNAKLFGGKIYSSGVYNLNGGEDSSSKLYVLFRNLSLKNITDSIPGTEGYITGKFRGIISLKQQNHKTRNLDGLIDLWTFKSGEEERKIGRAFLERLGAKERFFLGTNKSYDNGELHGYIKDGIITFSEMEISNSILGLNDLNIKVHNKRNSISVTHLLSVIRETARRVEKGTLNFEFEK